MIYIFLVLSLLFTKVAFAEVKYVKNQDGSVDKVQDPEPVSKEQLNEKYNELIKAAEAIEANKKSLIEKLDQKKQEYLDEAESINSVNLEVSEIRDEP